MIAEHGCDDDEYGTNESCGETGSSFGTLFHYCFPLIGLLQEYYEKSDALHHSSFILVAVSLDAKGG